MSYRRKNKTESKKKKVVEFPKKYFASARTHCFCSKTLSGKDPSRGEERSETTRAKRRTGYLLIIAIYLETSAPILSSEGKTATAENRERRGTMKLQNDVAPRMYF